MTAALRSWLARAPGAAALRNLLRRTVLAAPARRRRFVETYANNYWRGTESRSGHGSSLVQTEAVREALPQLCREYGVGSLLDVPCGDFHWMRLVDLSGVHYTGVDIVPALIADNTARFGDAGRRFVALDLVTAVPPRADLVLCRDLLVHLPNADILRALRNIKRSGAAWLLATTFEGRVANRDLATEDWRPLNLRLPPFGFPAPAAIIDERCTDDDGRYADKALALWRVADLL